MPGCNHGSLQKAAWSVLTVLGETFVRLVLPYLEYPWRLARLCNPALDREAKLNLVKQFRRAKEEKLDVGFSLRLRSAVNSVDDLLPGGRFEGVIRLLSITKVINVEIEDNFARAAAMRRAGAGRPYSQHGAGAKHVLAELKAIHEKGVRKSIAKFPAKKRRTKKATKQKPKRLLKFIED